MNDKNTALNTRQKAILKWLESDGVVRVEHMVRRYQVTEQTIRRDLTWLAQQRLITRLHGAAKPLNS
ncbi:MAG: DeoR family transcriptional regulator, partial [Porticoccaceae bacterium]|nr:DeoR family transcriptional regulator [Porticoccaceae bacterium]